jgi:serine/threonine protein kinase
VNFEDESVLEEFVQGQTGKPMHYKENDGYFVYQSHNQFGPLQVRLGPIVPAIADFGHAQWIDNSQPQINPIQSDYYRAPEVIMGVGWSSSADIWNLGALVCAAADFFRRKLADLVIWQLWTMLEGPDTNLLANIHSSDGKYMARNHLAQMIALLGPPPRELTIREYKMRSWNFAPAIENDENQLCHKPYQFYHGPFFDKEGTACNTHDPNI